MSRLGVWSETAPQIIYQSYPDADLLPIEAPKPGETISQFRVRAEDAGDTLFSAILHAGPASCQAVIMEYRQSEHFSDRA